MRTIMQEEEQDHIWVLCFPCLLSSRGKHVIVLVVVVVMTHMDENLFSLVWWRIIGLKQTFCTHVEPFVVLAAGPLGSCWLLLALVSIVSKKTRRGGHRDSICVRHIRCQGPKRGTTIEHWARPPPVFLVASSSLLSACWSFSKNQPKHAMNRIHNPHEDHHATCNSHNIQHMPVILVSISFSTIWTHCSVAAHTTKSQKVKRRRKP